MFSKITISPAIYRKIRDRSGLSQDELAKRLGCSLRTISYRESKANSISIEEMCKLLLETSVSEEERKSRQQVIDIIEYSVRKLISETIGEQRK